jgi:hypothetical protein
MQPMTERLERGWMKSKSPLALIALLRGRATQRKARLFACAYCRKVWHVFWDERSRRAVEQAELYADGLISEGDMAAARKAGYEPSENPLPCLDDRHWVALADAIMLAAHAAAADATFWMPSVVRDGICAITFYSMREIDPTGDDWKKPTTTFRKQQGVVLCRLLHDIFGNPFRPVILDNSRRTSTVTSLAQAIYDDRAFDRMPILADALEDAGCSNQDILQHCRSGGEHVRGCWPLDLVLGKE